MIYKLNGFRDSVIAYTESVKPFTGIANNIIRGTSK